MNGLQQACTAFAFASAAVFGGAGAAYADLVYTMRTKALAMDPPAMLTHRMSMAADRMALHSAAGDKRTEMVFRGDRKVLWMIEPAAHAYTEVDEASVKALAAQIGPVIEHMRERMAQLGPEERAAMEEILRLQAKGPATTAPQVEARKTAAKEKIAGYDCVRWDILRDGVKTGEIWATPWKAAGVGKEDFAVLRDLNQFLATLHAASPATRDISRGGDLVGDMDRVDGFPVRIRHFEDGVLASESTLESLDKRKLESTLFEVPAGYTKREFGPSGR